ncbi:MAG: hypothetical protein DI589_11960 [Shinella sp.]|nr:MAG: hypothetical protein DI589_11960 [Shinella sp.]
MAKIDLGPTASTLPTAAEEAIAAASLFRILSKYGYLGAVPFVLSKIVRVLVIGDSIPAGRSSGSGAVQMSGARALSWPTAMKAALTGMGFPASAESWAEAKNTGGTIAEYDPRVSLGGWSVGAGAGPGGYLLQATGSGAALSFAASTAIDTIEFYHVTNSTGGSGSYAVDSDAATTFSANGTAALTKRVASVALGLHTAKMNWVSGTIQAAPMVAYNSAVKQFVVMNMGIRGSTTADWVDASFPWRPYNAITTYAPDISLISLGINDLRAAGPLLPLATTQANLQTIITKATSGGGKAILVLPPPPSVADEGSYTYADLVALYISLGAANSCPVVRTDLIFGSHDRAALDGFTSPADGLHYNGSAYAMMAGVIAAAVRDVAKANFAAA